MAYLSLYRKYRPQTFAEILGQEHVAQTLAHAVDESRVAHAYLFTGPRGTGKTSTARILAKALNCERGPTSSPCGECRSCVAIAEGSSLDVIEMDAASHSKVEETREILTGVPLATAGGRKKVYVIDEVHMLTTQSFNALLKTLEEPPDHVVFVLATTEAHKVLPTIVSRTQRFDFRRVPAEAIESCLAEVAKLENVNIDAEAAALLARHADGSVRDGLSTLDQLTSLGGPITAADVEAMFGERRTDALFELFDAIATEDVGTVFRVIDSVVSAGADPRQVALAALGHSRSLVLLKTAPDAQRLLDVPSEDLATLSSQAERFFLTGLLKVLDLLGKAITDMRTAPNHRLLLEVALVRAAAPDTDTSTGSLVARIERLEREVGMGPREAKEPEAPVEVGKTAAPANPPDAAHIGLNHVRDAWTTTLKEVNNKSRRVGAFLNPSTPLEYTSERLVVEVQSPFHRDAMSEERNRAVMVDALHTVLGVRVDVVFVERGASRGSTEIGSGGSNAPAVAEPHDLSTLDDAEKVTPAEDPVELIKRGLAAEIVEERQEP